MSRGIGALQRRVIDALVQRRENDSYDAADLVEVLGGVEYDPQRPKPMFWSVAPVVRAHWRWYTLDLLDLAQASAPRSQRVSLHRAVRGLHRRQLVEIATARPYGQRFGAYENEYGDLVGGFDLSELSSVDPRWPTGRGLWFRLPAPSAADNLPAPSAADNEYPPLGDEYLLDDQMVILEHIAYVEDFAEFTGTLNRPEAWRTDVGRFIRWLFCGPLPEAQSGT